MTGTMIKVDRAELLKELERARTRALREHEKEVASYPERISAWNVKAAKALESFTGRLNGKPIPGIDSDYRGRITVTIPATIGPKPEKPRSESSAACSIDRMIKTVRLVKAETFQLRTDDSILRVVFPDRC
jgi:hypothetical protein